MALSRSAKRSYTILVVLSYATILVLLVAFSSDKEKQNVMTYLAAPTLLIALHSLLLIGNVSSPTVANLEFSRFR
ncbi:hypothetical protein M5689_002051 [Euphorbia peplus]|nr:hypothetical protein M5689_002051 [Euphorbia peplus]